MPRLCWLAVNWNADDLATLWEMFKQRFIPVTHELARWSPCPGWSVPPSPLSTASRDGFCVAKWPPLAMAIGS